MEDWFTLINGVKIPNIGTGPGMPQSGIRWNWADKIPVSGKIVNAVVRRVSGRYYHCRWVNSFVTSLKTGYQMIDCPFIFRLKY